MGPKSKKKSKKEIEEEKAAAEAQKKLEEELEAKRLAEKFVTNFKRYEDGVPADVVKHGGPNMDF